MQYFDLQTLQADLMAGKITCCQLANFYLQRIKEQQHLNAFIRVYTQKVLSQAANLDFKIANKEPLGKLAGMFVGLKDVICIKDTPVTAASKILQGFVSPYSATVVSRLENEDAIILGHLNCDEFAMGSTNEQSYYGATCNNLDTSKVPGGSSGASAVAVSANLCLAALGSDTGGSVRQPASFCNVVGLKPTYGRISRHGLIAYASSFDQIGILTHNIADAALLLEIIAGEDGFDATASQKPVVSYSKHLQALKQAKIAYLPECINNNGLDPEIKQNMEQLFKQLKAKNHIVEPVSFPYLDYLVPTYYILVTAEATTNLARYDGMRYGYRSPNATTLDEVYTLSRSEGFGKEVKRRIIAGNFVLSSGFYDSYYGQAQKIRRLIQNSTLQILSEYDFILTPTTPTTAFNIGSAALQNPIAMYLSDIYTVQANLAGIPAVSLPLFKHSNGLPYGVQIMGNKFDEAKLLAFSKQLLNP